jgi:hypothetical protein
LGMVVGFLSVPKFDPHILPDLRPTANFNRKGYTTHAQTY